MFLRGSRMAHRLEEQFLGEEAWSQFVGSVSQRELNGEFAQMLHEHKDIAIVVWNLLGESSVSWLSQRVPALDGLTPTECLATPTLIHRLKSMLMRMPS